MKNKEINSLKGILMLMIMFYHYTYRFQEIYGINTVDFQTLSTWGTFGVACFFIISGYFIFPKNIDNYSVKNYLVKRLVRLIPAYWLCITTTFIVMKVFYLPGRNVGLLDYILNITMINGFIGVNYVDGAHWYLTYLLLFTLIVSLIIYVSKKYNINRKSLLLFWLFINVLTLILGQLFSPILLVNKLLGSSYLIYILIGVFLNDTLKKNSWCDKLICIIMLLSIIFYEGIVVAAEIYIFLCIFILAIKEKTKFLNNKMLCHLGDISYIAYLLHQNIGYCILIKFDNYLLVYPVLVIMFVLVISGLIYKYYDCFIQRKLRKELI